MASKKPTKAELTAVPIEHLDLETTKTVADLVDGYKHISFQARTLGLCASVLENAMTDPKCTVFFGGAGALTPGGLRKVMRDMVEFGLVDVVVTTGAIAYHDFYEAHGYRHYRSSPDADDIVLREHFLDRVYDTLADESLFRECDEEIAALADSLEPRPYSSREFLAMMGKIAEKDPNSLVGACYRKGIPYFVPALNDSSVGIALAKHHRDRLDQGQLRDRSSQAEVPADRRVLRRWRHAEELHLSGRSDHGGHGVPGEPAHVRGTDHDRRPAVGRAQRVHVRGEPVVGEVPQGREDGAEPRRCDDRVAAARRIPASERHPQEAQ